LADLLESVSSAVRIFRNRMQPYLSGRIGGDDEDIGPQMQKNQGEQT
jgi:hypothetical protein